MGSSGGSEDKRRGARPEPQAPHCPEDEGGEWGPATELELKKPQPERWEGPGECGVLKAKGRMCFREKGALNSVEGCG